MKTILKYLFLAIELIVYASLLYVAWSNAHWSVSLLLTLLVVTFQAKGISVRYIYITKRVSSG